MVSVSVRTILLNTAEDTENMAAELASHIQAPANIYLEGSLGSGKTTFAKGFLRGCGYEGLVKSPTFTLVETYVMHEAMIVHADLYRIHHSQELIDLGFRDYFNSNTIVLIEWASHARDWLPKPLLLCTLKMANDGNGRILELVGVGV